MPLAIDRDQNPAVRFVLAALALGLIVADMIVLAGFSSSIPGGAAPALPAVGVSPAAPSSPASAPVAAPVSPAPLSPAPLSPAPVSPAPVSPAPVSPAPVAPAPTVVTRAPAPPARPKPVAPRRDPDAGGSSSRRDQYRPRSPFEQRCRDGRISARYCQGFGY